MFLAKQHESTALSEKLNAALSANNLITSVNNNPWNSIVGVELTSQNRMASRISGLPKGLMKLMASDTERLESSPLPTTDYLLKKEFIIGQKHEIKASEVRTLFGDKVLELVVNGGNLESEEVKELIESRSYNEVLSEQIDLCVSSLTGLMKQTIAKYAGDILSGSVTLTGKNIEQTFLFEQETVASPSPLWSDTVNSNPFTDMRTVDNQLRGLVNNQYNGLRFGSTFMGQDVLSLLIQNPLLKNQISANTVSSALINLDVLNEFFQTYAIPTFGKINVDYSNVWIDENGTPQPIFDDDYIYAASNTELRSITNGLPSTPIVLSIMPPDMSALDLPEGSVQSTNSSGAAIQIIPVEPRRQGDERVWEVVAIAKVVIAQYRPFARMKVK
jgi:hypothetical protein